MQTSVPVIDLNDFVDLKKSAFIQTLGDAIKYFGFVRVKGHRVNTDITNPAYQAAQDFFALPEKTKIQYLIHGGKGQRGYTPLLSRVCKRGETPRSERVLACRP